MVSAQLIESSNNNFLSTMQTTQKEQAENNKIKSKIDGLGTKGDEKGKAEKTGKAGKTPQSDNGDTDAASALYQILLAMGIMMNMNMQSMAQGADHLSVDNNQIQKNSLDIDNLNSQLDNLGQGGSLADQAQYSSAIQIENTKLNGIQTDENITITHVNNAGQYNQTEQVQAQALLDLYAKMGHTKNS